MMTSWRASARPPSMLPPRPNLGAPESDPMVSRTSRPLRAGVAEPAWARCTVTAWPAWALAGRPGEPAATSPAASAATSPRATTQTNPWFTGAPPGGSPDPSRSTGAPPWGSPDPSGYGSLGRPRAAVEGGDPPAVPGRQQLEHRAEMDRAAALGGVG